MRYFLFVAFVLIAFAPSAAFAQSEESYLGHPLSNWARWKDALAIYDNMDSTDKVSVILGVRSYINRMMKRDVKSSGQLQMWHVKVHSASFCGMAHLSAMGGATLLSIILTQSAAPLPNM